MAEPDASAGADDAVPTPQVLASYAAYLHTRTLTAPEVSVLGSRAQVSVSVAARTLVLTFGHRNREWFLSNSEIHGGGQMATFARGKLAEAVAALLTTWS